ncbi:MAG: ankyrin repeat domain-containing protein [Candidatus Symbiobacter sp.]|nr:ankyrin repeat domain-containing protein [Candidatus Symbiobacter sp.]
MVSYFRHKLNQVSIIYNRTFGIIFGFGIVLGAMAIPGHSAMAVALIDAAQAGDEAKVISLLKSGTDVNTQDAHRNSALSAAITKGQINIVRILINAKANPNLSNLNGYTPLFEACLNNQPEIVKILLAARPDLDAQITNSQFQGFTAAMLLAYNNNTEILKLLIDAGANLQIVSTAGLATASLLAAQAGSVDALKMLLAAKVDINQVAEIGGTALVRAAENGNLKVVKFLIENGADINATNKAGWTPLMAAAWKGHADVLNYLISKNAPLDSKYRDGTTALMWAAFEGHADTASILIVAHAKLDERAKPSKYMGYDFSDKTALKIARERNFPEVVKLLVGAGARD